MRNVTMMLVVFLGACSAGSKTPAPTADASADTAMSDTGPDASSPADATSPSDATAAGDLRADDAAFDAAPDLAHDVGNASDASDASDAASDASDLGDDASDVSDVSDAADAADGGVDADAAPPARLEAHTCTYATAIDRTGEANVVITDIIGWSTLHNGVCIRVDAGTTVTWVGNFTSHPLEGGVAPTQDSTNPIDVAGQGVTGNQTINVVLSTPGDYPYFCRFHWPLMRGVVYVDL